MPEIVAYKARFEMQVEVPDEPQDQQDQQDQEEEEGSGQDGD